MYNIIITYVTITFMLKSASFIAKINNSNITYVHLYEIYVVLASAVEFQEFISDVTKHINFYKPTDYSDHII